MLYNREEYILRSHLGEEILYLDPMGSEDTTINIGRSETSFGIFSTVANNLKFIGSAKAFLDLNYFVDGVKADVELVQKKKNPITDDWDISYRGYLDFKTRKIEDNKFTVDFIQGGFKQLLEAQSKEKFEIDREESIVGKPITPLIWDQISFEGREIFKFTKFYTENFPDFKTESGDWSSGGSFREAFTPFPYKRLVFTHDFVAEPYETLGVEQRWDKSIANTIIRNVPYDIADFPVDFDWHFKVASVQKDTVSDLSYWIVLDKYSGGIDMIFENRTFIKRLPFPFAGLEEKGSYSVSLDMLAGESYAIGIYSQAKYGSFGSDGWLRVFYEFFTGSLTIPEDSFYERTGAPFIPASKLGNRFTEIFTGKEKFVSNLLTQGPWKDLGFTNGGLIRNLKKKVDVTNKDGVILETFYEDWPMAISFDDFYKSIHAVLPVGFGIASIGAKQFLRFEKMRYFFQPVVTIRLGEVAEFKESTAAQFVYSFITTGYTKGGNYEEEMGLDEYNVQTTWGSPVTKGERKYEVLGPSRADSYAVEQARRYPYSESTDRDTPFDKDNFLIDAKFIGRSRPGNVFQWIVNPPELIDNYEVRLWQDDFERAPIGVYSPNSAFNLRLSPANNMWRHAALFNASTFKFRQDYFRHASSEGNSELVTKTEFKPEIKENADVIVEDLSKPIFEAEWYNFEVPRTQRLVDQLTGSTEINGEMVNNYYGLVEFKANGQVLKGYLFTAEISEKITFKLAKAYGF